MAVTYKTGMRLTSTHGTPDDTTRIKRYVADEISLLDPNEYPLVVLLGRLRKKKSPSFKYEWYEDAYAPIYVTTTEAGSSGEGGSADTITIGTGEGDYVHKWDVLLNMESGEAYLVTAENTTDEVQITRGFGGTTVDPIGSGDKLFIVGNAAEEGGTPITARTTVKDNKYNFTQIFKETLEGSRTLDSTALYGGKDRTYLRRKHAVKLQRLIERSFWWGFRDEDTSSGTNTVHATGGILADTGHDSANNLSYISTNITTNTNQLTEDNLELHLEGGMRYGPKVKTAFCGPRACSAIRKIAVSQTVNLYPKDTTYGLSIMRYISAHGELNIVPHAMFYDMADSAAAAGTWGNPAELMVILDLEQLNYMYLDDVFVETNIETPGTDGWKDQYIGEVGVRMKQEKHHSYIINVDVGA